MTARSTVDDADNWRIDDPHRDMAIDDIFPISERLKSIYARVNDRNSGTMRPLNVLSLIFSTEGLEYHASNFKRLTKNISKQLPRSAIQQRAINDAKHEAVAYLNLAGQIYTWVMSVNGENNTPIMKQLYATFRNKHTAHRSIDSPRGESPEEQEAHLMVLQGLIINTDNEVVFQMQHPLGISTYFNLTRDHEEILNELLDVYKSNIH